MLQILGNAKIGIFHQYLFALFPKPGIPGRQYGAKIREEPCNRLLPALFPTEIHRFISWI